MSRALPIQISLPIAFGRLLPTFRDDVLDRSAGLGKGEPARGGPSSWSGAHWLLGVSAEFFSANELFEQRGMALRCIPRPDTS